jgi:hypothetical protein
MVIVERSQWCLPSAHANGFEFKYLHTWVCHADFGNNRAAASLVLNIPTRLIQLSPKPVAVRKKIQPWEDRCRLSESGARKPRSTLVTLRSPPGGKQRPIIGADSTFSCGEMPSNIPVAWYCQYVRGNAEAPQARNSWAGLSARAPRRVARTAEVWRSGRGFFRSVPIGSRAFPASHPKLPIRRGVPAPRPSSAPRPCFGSSIGPSAARIKRVFHLSRFPFAPRRRVRLPGGRLLICPGATPHRFSLHWQLIYGVSIPAQPKPLATKP